ncbi:Protein RRP5-like [Holothuria leucospilota]|uniref:Protein RRP5-like n=1 Tax=Holothuria leucospilota TaxID=206669 RepID=A0A9Q0YTZ8_HOLLE|nr:Protein RRP5-like [Holothuria leucospilota]
MEEKYFPRGLSEKKVEPAKGTKTVPRKRKLHDEAEEAESNRYLFGSQASTKKSRNAKEKERKRRKRQEAKKIREGDDDDDEVEDNEHHILEGAKQLEEEDKFVEDTFESKPFHLKILKEDMLVLGAVKEIREFELIVSLPNGIIGHVQITKISNAFTNLLEKLSTLAMEEEALESATSLNRLYNLGDLVSCRVLEVKAEKNNYTKVDLSLNPADVNKDLMISMIHTNMILNGVVQSVEDHGYTIETGIEGVNVFLDREDADDYLKMNQGRKLRIAEPVRCLVTKVASHNRFVSVTLDVEKISEIDSSSSPIAELQPGRRITAVVQKVKETSLKVSFGSGYQGCVDVTHLREIIHTTKMYKRNQEHKAVIIYQCPTTKTFGVSLNPAHFGWNISDGIKKSILDGVKTGTKVKKSKILRVDEKRGALCDLHTGYKGYAVPSDYPEKQQPPSVNDVLPCRVLYFQLFDLIAKVSFKDSILTQRFLGYSEISPGQLVEGQVLNILDNGVSVQLEKNVTGFISREHVADIPIKNIAGLFQEGGTIKMRVLMVNPEERKLLLTHKKTLVESQLPIITSYDQFEEGQIIHGTIIFIKDYGCVVKFYNNVSGLIHRTELSNNSSIDPTANFYKGQVVKCQVIKTFNPELQKCHLSLRHVTGNVSQQGDNEGDSQNSKITSGTVTALSKEGLTIVTRNKKKEAFIPMMHLCDHPSQEKIALKSFKVGDNISPVLVWGKEGKKLVSFNFTFCILFCEQSGHWWHNRMIIITYTSYLVVRMEIASCKPMICRLAKREYRSISSPFNLEENAVTLCVVEEVSPEGILVSFPDNFIGFCPRNFDWGLEGTLPFSRGEIVKVKVGKIQWREKKAIISLNISDVFQRGDEDLVHDLLLDQFELQDKMSRLLAEKGVSLSELKVGSTVTGHVTKVKDGQVLAKVEGSVTAVICENEGSDLSVGSSISGCVLDVDYIHRYVIITLNEQVALAAKKKVGKRKGLKKLQSKTNSGYADVVFTSDLYHLVLIDDQLAYTPTKNHLNDSSSRSSVIHSIPIGQKRVMKKLKGRLVVQPLAQREEKKKSSFQAMGSYQSSWSNHPMESQHDKDLSEETKAKVDLVSRSMGVSLGQTVTVIVKAVYKEYALVRTESDVLGRIHMTELTDNLPRGKSLLDACHGGQKLTARIIGFLYHKEGCFSQIKHPRFTRLALELTTRPSKLGKSYKIEEKTSEEELESYKTGQKVLTFPISYSKDYVIVLVSPRIQGVIHIQDLSHKFTVQTNPERFFPYACALPLEVSSIERDTMQLVLTCHSKKGKGIAKVRSGQVVAGKVTDIVEGFIHIQLPGGVMGSAFVTDVRDHFQAKALKGFSPGQLIKCYILSMEDNMRAAVSLRPSRVTGKKEEGIDKDIQSMKDLREGEEVKGYIMIVTERNITVSLSRNISAKLPISPSLASEDYVPGLPIKVVVKSIKKEKVTLSFPGDEEVKRISSEEKGNKKGVMEEDRDEEESDEDDDEEGDGEEEGHKEKSTKSELSISHDEKVGGKFCEDSGDEGESTDEEDKSDEVDERGDEEEDGEEERSSKHSIIPAKDVGQESDDDEDESSDGDEEEEETDEEGEDKVGEGDENKEPIRKSSLKGERTKSEDALAGRKKEAKITKVMDKKKAKGKTNVVVTAESSESEETEEESEEEKEGKQEPRKQSGKIKGKEIETTKKEIKDLKKGQTLDTEDRLKKQKDNLPTTVTKEVIKEEGVAKERGKKRKDVLPQEKKSQMRSLEKPRLQISDMDAWDEEPVSRAAQKEDSDSESDEEEKVAQEPPKKKTKQQKQEEARKEEEFLYKMEHSLMDSDRPPETVDDFDRLVTTSPNSSIVWIRFMAFHLDAGDIERARAVAERALKTINFREEQEKLNVWVAFMNLENSSGTEETLLKVFERALSNCEPYKVFEHLIEIYTRSGKIESAEALYNTMLKRFKQEKSVWVQFGTFLMNHGKPEAARNLLQRSFKSLPKKDHVDCISKFAQLEYKSGEPDQGQTMFENILSNYPKRTDIWSIYLDMVIKSGDLKASRHLFDRVITLNLSPKKIKFFFKRYLEFEKKHGTEEQVNAVKQKAVEYVESKAGLELSET